MIKNIQSVIRKFSAFFSFSFEPAQAPLYIFDLDGTLSLADDRRHYVECADKDWDAFHRAASRDKPNIPVALALRSALEYGCDVFIWSGRSENVRQEAIYWLAQHLQLPESIIDDILKMRPSGDFTPDEQLKKSWLDALPHKDYSRIQAVYDDRQKVVDMWRANGIPCFQVAPGGF